MSSIFSKPEIARLSSLARGIARQIQQPVTASFGISDCGQRYAALCVEELPQGSFGTPGVLVSILEGTGIDGTDVMSAIGEPVALGASFARALRAGKRAALREYDALSDGALQIQTF